MSSSSPSSKIAKASQSKKGTAVFPRVVTAAGSSSPAPPTMIVDAFQAQVVQGAEKAA